ncbi:MAG TPA: acyl-CoA dehydrogenase family protein [Mycobacteriales bacterium]|jgi:alkylation response protein AidB-like acyl-CoA dehydrogenase|nr:acyl-CoA dehydrogenase family protein [Mycobacteriales bacterium]
MDFTFSPEQRELREAVRALAADRSPSAQVRTAMESEAPYDAALWRVLGQEMGLLGLGVDESLGGAGGGFVDAAVVVDESGRALIPAPVLPTLVAGQVLARAGRPAAEALSGVVSGEQVATVGMAGTGLSGGGIGFGGDAGLSGVVPHVVDGAAASYIVLAGRDGLWLVRPGDRGVTVSAQQPLDPTRRQAVVRLDKAPAVALGDSAAADRAVDVLRVAYAVESVGIARRCLEMTVDYLKTREQFGRVIGSFQALQHRVADIAVQVEAAMSTAYYAAWTVEASPEELPVVAPLALAVCADAAWYAAAESIQLHGGIGFTWEHDAHLYFKRATTTRLLFGDAQEQRRLVAARARLL